MSDGLSRRSLIRGAGALAAGATLSPMARAFEHPMFHAKQASANDKLVIGLIGCGGMGAANMRNLMNYADVEIAALCDVDSNRIPGDFKTVEDKYKRKPDVYEDYRKMLDRKDIDAVIIGSPDHWHALQLIHACQAGKDSFCEKPLSHHLTESVAMAKAVEK